MKVVQWNCHHGGKRSDDVLDTAGFGDALVRLGADVICLNEVEQFHSYGNVDQVAVWLSLLGTGWKAAIANLSGVLDGHGQCNVILSKLPFAGVAAKKLHDARVAVAAAFGDTTILSTHLDDGSASVRCVETFQVMQWNVVASAQKLILCGDWNSIDGNVEQAPLQYTYKDAWKVAVAAKTNTSFNGTGKTRSSRIDAIFFNGKTLVSCDVPDTRKPGTAAFPSDHNPVVAIFK